MRNSPRFFVLSLPRSRSKWLSEFLSFGGRRCGHDLIVECGGSEEFAEALEGFEGSVETGAMLGWRGLRDRWPQAKILTVHRPIGEVYWSFRKLGLEISLEQLALREQMLLACAKSRGVMSVTFDQLNNFDACAGVFGHCLELGLEYDYWAEMNAKNIQIDMGERLARLAMNAPRLEAFKTEMLAHVGVQSWGLS